MLSPVPHLEAAVGHPRDEDMGHGDVATPARCCCRRSQHGHTTPLLPSEHSGQHWKIHGSAARWWHSAGWQSYRKAAPGFLCMPSSCCHRPLKAWGLALTEVWSPLRNAVWCSGPKTQDRAFKCILFHLLVTTLKPDRALQGETSLLGQPFQSPHCDRFTTVI